MHMMLAAHIAIVAFSVATPTVASAADFEAARTKPDQIDVWGRRNNSDPGHVAVRGARVAFDPKTPEEPKGRRQGQVVVKASGMHHDLLLPLLLTAATRQV